MKVATQEFKVFIADEATKRGLSIRALSKELGEAPSTVISILNGKRNLTFEFLQSLSLFLKIPLVSIYEKAGILDIEEDDRWYLRLKELAKTDTSLRKLVDVFADMPEEEREAKIRLILASMGKQ